MLQIDDNRLNLPGRHLKATSMPSFARLLQRSSVFEMLAPGIAQKITIHLNEDTAARHDFLYNEIFSFLRDHGVAGATLIRPAAGFGSHLRTHSIEGNAEEREHLPVRIEFIESKEAAAALLPALCELITDGLIESQETMVVKAIAQAEPR